MLKLGAAQLRLQQLRLRAFVLRLSLRHIGRRHHASLVAVLGQLPALLIGFETVLQQSPLRFGRTQGEISLRHRGLGRQPGRSQVIGAGLGRGTTGVHSAGQPAPQVHFPAGVQAQRKVIVDAAAARHILAIGIAIGAATRQCPAAAARGSNHRHLRSATAGHSGLGRAQPGQRLLNTGVGKARFLLQLVERRIVINSPPLIWHAHRAVTARAVAGGLPQACSFSRWRGLLELFRHVHLRRLKRLLSRAGSQATSQSGHRYAAHQTPACGHVFIQKSELLELINRVQMANFIHIFCLHKGIHFPAAVLASITGKECSANGLRRSHWRCCQLRRTRSRIRSSST